MTNDPAMPTCDLSPNALVKIASGEVVTWAECQRPLARPAEQPAQQVLGMRGVVAQARAETWPTTKAFIEAARSTPAQQAPSVVSEALEVALSQAKRGADKAGCDGWRAQEMCRQIVPLIEKAIAALSARVDPEPVGPTASDLLRWIETNPHNHSWLATAQDIREIVSRIAASQQEQSGEVGS